MSRKRKPVVRPIGLATDEVFWRAKVLCEFLETFAKDLPGQVEESIRRLNWALDDYEISKGVGANGSVPHSLELES
jgi:hypothetical protein